MNSNHLLSEPPLLQNKTFLRSILRDPDLKRRTMHACKHGVCRHRHTNTYTHACTHTHMHIYRDRRKKYPPSSNAFLPRQQAEETRKEAKGAVEGKRFQRVDRFFYRPIDRFELSSEISSTVRSYDRLLSFFSILRRWKIQSL